jgi:hypothetical protein
MSLDLIETLARGQPHPYHWPALRQALLGLLHAVFRGY